WPDDACWQLPNEALRLRSLRQTESACRFLQQLFILAGELAPGAQRLEGIAMAVFVHHGRERADLLDLIGGWHCDAGVGAEPAPVVKAVLGNKADARGDVVTDPLEDVGRIEVWRVGVADREVMRADRAFGVVGDAHTADVAVAPGPGGA